MATYTSSSGATSFLPVDTGPLVIQPLIAASVFAQVATTQVTGSHDFRIPVITADPTAAWVAEGAEIPVSDPSLAELLVTPSKVAGLTIISREMADDSDPAVATVVGEGLARDLARRTDQAAFAGLASPAAPGLTSVTGNQTYVNAQAFANLDFAAQAISKAETVGATVTAFITSPATALALSTIKQGTGSNAPLLGADPTAATSRSVLGVPVYVSSFVAANTLWAIDGSRVWMVVRTQAEITSDRSVFFTSDRVAVRATARVGFAFPHPQAIIKVTTA